MVSVDVKHHVYLLTSLFAILDEDGLSRKTKNMVTLLFYASVTEMVGACAVIFIATVIFEALKLLKQYLTLRLTENPLAGVQNSPDNSDGTDGNDDVILVSSLQFPVTVAQIRNQR